MNANYSTSHKKKDLRTNCLQSNKNNDFELFCEKKSYRHNLRTSTTGFNQTSKELINGFAACYNEIKEVSL